MKTIDEHLGDAGEALRRAAHQVPDRRPSAPVGRRRLRPWIAAAAGAAIAAAIALPALWLTSTGPTSQELGAPGPDDPPESGEESGSVIGFEEAHLWIDETRFEALSFATHDDGSATLLFSDRTSDVVFALVSGNSGFILDDFEGQILNQGAVATLETEVRGVDGLVQQSGSGVWGLVWTDDSPTSFALFVEGSSYEPGLLTEVAETLIPIDRAQHTHLLQEIGTISEEDALTEFFVD